MANQPEDFKKSHPFAPTGWEPPKTAPTTDAKTFEQSHPFAPTGWGDNPIDAAVEKFNKQMQAVARPLIQNQTPSGYLNLDIFLARLNRIEQMIDGATIGATCSGTSTIITLTWGN